MGVEQPKVSIGLPVYNGEPYLRQAIEAQLVQTFEDFELVIVDNASTDDTETICRSYVEADERVRYTRNERNIGVIRNHNRTMELATGELFKWVSADDLYEPTYLERCIEVLAGDPEVVLACTKIAYIDERSEVSGLDEQPFEFGARSPSERFRASLDSDCTEEFGLIRRSALIDVGLLGSYRHYDGVHLTRLALRGRFHQTPERLLKLRRHAAQTHKRRLVDPSQYAATLDPDLTGKWMFPSWRLTYEYISSIRSAPIGVRERMLCYRHLANWVRWHARGFKEDVVHNAGRALRVVRGGG